VVHQRVATMAEATTLLGSATMALAAAMGTAGAMADTATAGATAGIMAMVSTGNDSSRATMLVDSNGSALAMVATTCGMAGSNRGAQPMTGTTGSTAILRRS